ncbi:TetR/AcrR family transcriptional regulator [Micromonospora sp. NPDC048999]|uniref:TetR/AcrR family transcriptional regulator n=1 Tax=Micromonospora sp. NPDC048999 TaxID=3155391 RepID=UPI0033D8D517
MSDSRTALLDAAAEEFARTGLHGTRVQAIVKRAGVNERMIYHHFGSKEGLYAAVIDEQRAALGSDWAPVLDRAATLDPYEGMRTAFASFFDILRARPRLLALMMHESLSGTRLLSLPTADQLPKTIRELYERGQHEGTFRADCPFEIAYATAMGALVALQIFAPRFAAVSESGAPALRDRVLGQLLDGMTGPVSGR